MSMINIPDTMAPIRDRTIIIEKTDLEYLFHHLFLPPKLPGGDDNETENGCVLIDFVLHSLAHFLREVEIKASLAVLKCIGIIQMLGKSMGSGGRLSESGVGDALQQLSNEGVLSLYIAAQNAGVLICKTTDSVRFETFELSPTNISVVSTRGRLIRNFPANAIEISADDFSNDQFRTAMTQTLVKMGNQTVQEMKPKMQKAGQEHDEERDTPDPSVVTELLTSILQGMGKQACVNGIRKNTREEVMWGRSKLPWRRSPLWLLIRVALQLTMVRLTGSSEYLYKPFMSFLMAKVLESANQHPISSEDLQTMRAKITRRICKLGSSCNGKWLRTIKKTMSASSKLLEDRWQQIQQGETNALDLKAISDREIEDSTNFALPEVETFLSSIPLRAEAGSGSDFKPTPRLWLLQAGILPSITNLADEEYRPFRLAMVESWVASHLDQWLEKHIHEESSCQHLAELMRSYYSEAHQFYARNPEGASRMILTVGELWIAADKVALHAIPMLNDYDSEVPTELWQALLLGSITDMQRLHKIETYILKRQNPSSVKYPSIFRSYGDKSSFPVRYFAQSPGLQKLKQAVDDDARAQRQSKLKEFRKLKARYKELMRKYEESTCENVSEKQRGIWVETHYSNQCSRCCTLSNANSLRIHVHEWPLPDALHQAETVVFELEVPRVFSEWRDATIYIIYNVLRCSLHDRQPDSHNLMRTYEGLNKYFNSGSYRIHLLSETKSHLHTHRKTKSVGSSTESDVCVNNGLQYQYYDDSRGIFLSPVTLSKEISTLCTFQLPERARALNPFLLRSYDDPNGKTPNAVMAEQSSCPEHMTTDEFKALSVLPYGYRLPWMNILTQLAMPTIDFNKAETAIFLLQISLQAGPNSLRSITRCAHTTASDLHFGRAILQNLRDSILRVKENWESHTALYSFTLLASRLMSLTAKELHPSFLAILQDCREACYGWLLKLIDKVKHIRDEKHREEFSETALVIALICADTFNVEDAYMREILDNPYQASLLVEISIIIHNTSSPSKIVGDILEQILYNRWLYTMHRARNNFFQLSENSQNACLNLAVERRWPTFQPTSQWRIARSTCDWFETTSGNLKVHLNILTGKLLVDGKPLARLPRNYEEHDDYEKIFGSLVLDVVPSSLPGMQFSIKDSFYGYVVHFGMQDSLNRLSRQDLLVHANGNGSTLDLIPPHSFNGLLPHTFVKDYTHWYDAEAEVIEFRPLENPWVSSPDNWRLKRRGDSWKMRRSEWTFLLAPSGFVGQYIATILAPLEELLSMHIIYTAEKTAIEVQIPRLHLEFLLSPEDPKVRSKQYREMHIDPDQSIGTLFGFKSKLVLRNQHDQDTRMLLVPQGKVQYDRATVNSVHSHVRVSVGYGSSHRVQAYHIDKLLGRLLAKDKVENKLYLAYLHALTSFCLPDPFLGRTGTDQALDILRSASIRAPSNLTKAARHTLDLIADLTPNRLFYPKHLRVMQTVVWSSALSYLSQDDRFYKITDEIIERSRKVDFLYSPNSEFPVQQTKREMELVERSIIRTSMYHVSGFGAEDFSTQYDAIYQQRDCKQPGKGTQAAEMAFRIYNNRVALFQRVSGTFVTYLYEFLQNGTVISTGIPPQKREMQYDSVWLQGSQEHLASLWCQIHTAFQNNRLWLNKFELMIWISTLSYSKKYDNDLVQAFLMLALSPSVAATPLPPKGTYNLTEGYQAQAPALSVFARNNFRPFDACPEAYLNIGPHETARDLADRRNRMFQLRQQQAVTSFSLCLVQQWPCATPITPVEGTVTTYIAVWSAMEPIFQKWASWWDNLQFKNYLEDLASNLKRLFLEDVTIKSLVSKPIFEQGDHQRGFVSIDDLFPDIRPFQYSSSCSALDGFIQEAKPPSNTNTKLIHVLDFLEFNSNLEYEHQYLKELRESVMSLHARTGNELAEGQSSTRPGIFKKHLDQCSSLAASGYESISRDLRSARKREISIDSGIAETTRTIMIEAEFLPRISPILLLQQPKTSRWSRLPDYWKRAVLNYGLAITTLQKAKRLIISQHDSIDLLRELENPCHLGWNPQELPEWLLLECESEITIREVQQQIAQQMIWPTENAVMQLNMGEGKSSVIAPIVATALGDGSKLVRVIVAKPQARQMHQMLVSKLSGLLDRPVYELPFSRDIKMDGNRAVLIHQLMEECMKEGGVLMVQPEHLLSFQLMELECGLSVQSWTAEKMAETRRFFETFSRDVVDESDENFSIKFELVYTLGQQQPIEHSPDRWTIIQEVLGLVRDVCFQEKLNIPEALAIDDSDPAKFPKIRFLRRDAAETVLNRVARGICLKGITGFPISHQPPTVRNAVFRYITEWKLSVEEVEDVETRRFWAETTINHILLLRGLFGGGILAFAFCEKRWRVNYGIDPNRETKLSVPFRAKDNLTPRSEFSHPDVVITFTCISYYYGGLDDEALFSAFNLLVRSDDANQEYQAWVMTAPTLPESFRHLQGINIRDYMQCRKEVFPYLRYSKAAIDYYLSRMVFAKESKEFPHKLSASGWDLGKRKKHPTTGFSGTNDSRYVLPLDIKQLDIQEQRHTNALVLEYLLRPDNGISLMTPDMHGSTFDSNSLLQLVESLCPETRVILDVGAQVIDLDNLEFSREWLRRSKGKEDTQAVIFFNGLDEIVVLHRSGKIEDLQTSPFADRLDQCLVFLDEAHTRGTDLRLPANYQAAVTLGANLTKDKLVQACMRMRKLGKGQTVVFCIPREIEHKILKLHKREISTQNSITVSEVLCWTIAETFVDLRKSVPLWLNQGVRFYKQKLLWDALKSSEESKRLEISQSFMEDEAHSLEIRYSPKYADSSIASILHGVEFHAAEEFNRRCQDFGLKDLQTSSLQEEQERELSPEAEQERQIERPPPAKPAIHHLHQDVINLVKEGVFHKKSKTFKSAFKALNDTSAAKHFNLGEFPHKIWVTGDFATTVNGKFGSNGYSDYFQRSVQWIVTHRAGVSRIELVIVSPYEVQHLLPMIADSKHVTLHLYSPRINMGFKSLDDLRLYSIPQERADIVVRRDIIMHLNLFAGQLYLSSFRDYTRMCDSLGIAWRASDESVVLGPDGFIPPGVGNGDFVNKSGFSKSPVQFLKVLMAKIRQKGELIHKTHVGKILEGERLDETEFKEGKKT